MVRYSECEILGDFLRLRVTDPQTTNRHTLTSDSFTATAAQTDFTLTPTSGKTAVCVSSVTVDAVTKVKWQDYYVDLQNQKVIFVTAMSGAEAVVVNYYEGSTSWIFWDKTREDLSATSYPRMSIEVVTSPGERLGRYNADVEYMIHFQVNVWTKENDGAGTQIFTIGTRKYHGEPLAHVLGAMVCDALKDNESDLHPIMYGYSPITGPRTLPFDRPGQRFHIIVEFYLKMLNIGDDLS